jgi:hypothetical protein
LAQTWVRIASSVQACAASLLETKAAWKLMRVIAGDDRST